MNNYRVVDIYELADFIADETDEEVLAALHILEEETLKVVVDNKILDTIHTDMF